MFSTTTQAQPQQAQQAQQQQAAHQRQAQPHAQLWVRLQAQPQHVPLLPALRQLQQEQLIWQQPDEQLRKAVVEAARKQAAKEQEERQGKVVMAAVGGCK